MMYLRLRAVRQSSVAAASSAHLMVVAVAASLALAACGRSPLQTFVDEFDGGTLPDGGGKTDKPGDGRIDGIDAGQDGAVDRADAPVDRVDGAADGTIDGKRVVSLLVSPAQKTLAIGGSADFSASVVFSDGTTADVTTTAIWTSSDPRVATVRAGHVIALMTAGKVTISAATAGFTGAATLSVVQMITLVQIALDPPTATLTVGSSVMFTATGTFNDGTTSPVTAMATWTSSDGTIASVTGGKATAVAAGTATISASVGLVTGKATVTVTAATVVGLSVIPPLATTAKGAKVSFAADATLSNGTHQDVTASATWTSSDTTVATVDANGTATGAGAGKTTIGASFAGASASAILTVTGANLLSLQIDPVDPQVGVGVALTFTLTGLYDDGSKADLTASAMWQSSAPGVVSIDASGKALTKSAGTSVVSGAAAGKSVQSTVTVTAAALTSIAVTPANSTLSIGDTLALKATGQFSDGSSVDLTTTVVWSDGGTGVVSVSNATGTAGVVTALSNGATKVTATSGGVIGAAAITVSPATLKSLTVAPGAASVPIGVTTKLTAQGVFTDGTTRDVTTQVAWTSSNNSVATVSNLTGSEGTVTGVSTGTVTVSAALEGVNATSSITVVAAAIKSITVAPANATTVAGLRSNYTAQGVFSDGSTRDVTTAVVWSTGNTATATISNVSGAEGQLLARAAGTTTVVATLGAVSGQTNVTVGAAAASSLSLSPIATSTPLGRAVQYTATLVLSNGTARNVTGQATFMSSATGVATIDNRGRAQPVATGTTTISASYMGLSATTTLTVTDAVIASLEVTPIAPMLAVGTTVQFTATAILSDDSTRNVTGTATWVSSAPGVLGVNTARNRGQATAVGAGTAVVTATFMGVSGDTKATVIAAVSVSISVSPIGLTVPAGTRRQFTAQLILSDGSSTDVTGRATWTSDATAVAAVSSAGGTRGVVTAIGAGTANIKAAFNGLSGTTAITVTAATLSTIQVTPFNQTVTTASPVQYTATGLFSDGTSLPLTGMATWDSSDMTVAQISNAGGTRGRAVALKAGTTMISATFGGVTGSTPLTVTDATITQIQVTPFNPTVAAGFSAQMTATAIFSDGTNRDITALATWTPSAAASAFVSDAAGSKGLVTAVVAGQATIIAQYQAVSGSTIVTVSSAKLTAISIGPATPTVAVNGTAQLSATGTFDDLTTLDLTTLVTWTSGDISVADVSNADGSRGQASGFTAGTTTITAQRGSITGNALLTVK
ncbi:MAG TPA: Ig-like domain-containing protein [Polyangia bacterium]|jgi:uncharacterized protein YjdB